MMFAHIVVVAMHPRVVPTVGPEETYLQVCIKDKFTVKMDTKRMMGNLKRCI